MMPKARIQFAIAGVKTVTQLDNFIIIKTANNTFLICESRLIFILIFFNYKLTTDYNNCMKYI